MSASSAYNTSVAMEFFRSAGKPKAFAKGRKIFSENQRGIPFLLMPNRMYLLLDGEVAIFSRGRPIGTVRPGQIFGEMASIDQGPRSGSAVARSACRVIALDNRQLQTALGKKPEFALMLMSVMIGRIRGAVAQMGKVSATAEANIRESAVFDKTALGILARALAQTTVRYDRGAAIVKEGQVGVLMYVVLEGRLAVSIQGKLVERIGAGGVFGEMALVDRTPRLATVTAETPCALLAIARNTFLDLIRASPEFAVSLLGAVGERARFIASRDSK